MKLDIVYIEPKRESGAETGTYAQKREGKRKRSIIFEQHLLSRTLSLSLDPEAGRTFQRGERERMNRGKEEKEC